VVVPGLAVSSDLDSATWLRATSLTERIASLRSADGGTPLPDVDVERVEERVRRWGSRLPSAHRSFSSERATFYGISEEVLLYLAGERTETMAARVAETPGWLRDLRHAFAAPSRARPGLGQRMPARPGAGRFLEIVEPLVGQARRRLREALRALPRATGATAIGDDATEEAVFANVPGLLLPMLGRTMALELNVARMSGRLVGDSREARFENFCEGLRDRRTALSILREYPVLARQLVTTLDRWVSFSLEFLGNLRADWRAIRQTFCPHGDPGVLVSLDGHKGDRHRRGRCTLIATFRNGFRLVYKPRSVAIDRHFQGLLTWLNDRGWNPELQPMGILDRGSHGWLEFVPFRSCRADREVRRFYHRQGAYLALLYTLEATDFHFENLVAAGEHPFLVDLETLFHPRVEHSPTRGREPAGAASLRDSVLRVGLLPHRVAFEPWDDGVDLSGMGAAAGQTTPYIPQWEEPGTDEMRLLEKPVRTHAGHNRPIFDGREVDLLEHADAIAAGFVGMYRFLLEHRDEMLAEGGPLSHFADDEIRVVLRPTREYALLLQSSFHPDVLRDAVDRDMLLDALWDSAGSRPHLRQVVNAELEDLRGGDVPIFVTSGCSVDLLTSAGERITGFLDHSPLSLVQRRLSRLSEADLERQLGLTRASLATVGMGGDTAHWPRYRLPSRHVSFDARRLIAAACSIGDRLEALALSADGGDVAWIGVALTGKSRWSVVPAGLDLYSGRSGIVLFLSYLGAVAEEPRFSQLARVALDTIRRQLQETPLHKFPIGAFDGLAGVAYTLAHLGVLWEDPDLLREATRIGLELTALSRDDGTFDIVSGSAGCLASLIALHEASSSDQVLMAALRFGDHLLEHSQSCRPGLGWPSPVASWGPLTGFSHGAAGIGWALLKLAELSGERRFRDAALEAYRYERSLYAVSGTWRDLRKLGAIGESPKPHNAGPTTWCHGAGGIALARLRSLEIEDCEEIRGDIAAALEAVWTHGFGWNHSLCHGDLGNLEVLTQAATTLEDRRWEARREQMAAKILEGAEQNGWLCGLPLGVEAPGLMTGMSGIGLGVLRAAAPRRVPSVLTLDPPLISSPNRPRRRVVGMNGV
jgi:type 2 lantibiotic biosynthesis protein LanM